MNEQRAHLCIFKPNHIQQDIINFKYVKYINKTNKHFYSLALVQSALQHNFNQAVQIKEDYFVQTPLQADFS